MRRILSLVLLAAFGLPVAAPAFTLGQDVESSLPACCRRHGAHHCTMGNMQRAADSAPVASSRCPSYPQPSTAPPLSGSSALLSTPARMAFAQRSLLVQQSAIPRQSSAHDFALYQRGPPSQPLS